MENQRYRDYVGSRRKADRGKLPDRPVDKVFKPKNPELEILELENYKGVLPDSYWEKWARRELPARAESWIDPGKLRREAESVDIDREWIETVCARLEEGADIGCRGGGRLPTRERNSKTAAENGPRLADTLLAWVKAGILAGPFRPEELPWADFTLSPLTVRPKGDGGVRIILDMSAPHKEPEKDKDGNVIPIPDWVPQSVNAGIDGSKYPTKMSSTQQILAALHKVGVPVEAAKIDWSSAYKHQAVRLEDRKLQCIEFCGRIFVETQATFGCCSSPGIFDMKSYLLVEIAARRAGTDREAIEKQLDDVAVLGVKGTGTCGRFYEEYRRACQAVGVQLAPEDDPEKAFGPSEAGIILGIQYDFKSWTWQIPVGKMHRILYLLEEIITKKEVVNKLAMSVAGKITHYRVLTRFGHWERSFLLKLPEGTRKDRKVKVTRNQAKQARWWQVALLASASGERIPDIREAEALNRAVLSTDAAGGSGTLGVGMGGCVQVEGHSIRWFAYPWPEKIRFNLRNSDGVSLGQKLTMLEGAAVLAGLAGAATSLAGRDVTAYCDNAGFCYAWLNKGSRDLLSYTVAKAVADVAAGLGVDLVVRKVTRCSDRLSTAADDLSKYRIREAFESMGEDREEEVMTVPGTILRWLADPWETATLGKLVLREIKERHPALTVRDWRAWEDK